MALSQNQKAQMLAQFKASNGGGGASTSLPMPQGGPDQATIDQLMAVYKANPSLVETRETEAGPTQQQAQGTTVNGYTISLDVNTGQPMITKPIKQGGMKQEVTAVYDTSGKPLGYSSGDSTSLGLAKFVAGAFGMYGAGVGLDGMINGAATSATSGAASGATGGTGGSLGATGMTTAEQAAFLEANAGALAPGGEIAAGYGSSWGVGADGIIGQGATMAADGSLLNPGGADPTNYGNEGRNYPTPESTQGPGGSPVNSSMTPPTTPSTPNSPSTPKNGNTPPGSKTPGNSTPWTLRDTMQLGSAALGAAGAAGGGSGGSDGEADPRLADAQLRSLDAQEQMLNRMIGNADMILPFQKDALEFGLSSAKEAYGDYRADRQYALGRRLALTGLQDRMVSDAENFNTDARREELAGNAVMDVNRAYSGALDSAKRTMTRAGRSLDDGRWGSTLRQMVGDKVLAQAQGANVAREQARKEGYALTDRAAGALSYAPAMATATTAGGASVGGSGVGLVGNTASSMQSTLAPAASLAGAWGSNATSMYNAQKNGGVGSGKDDYSAYGALLAGGLKAYDAWKS